MNRKNNNFKSNKKGFNKFLIWLLVAIIVVSGVYFIVTFNQAKANAEIKELVDLNNTLYTEIDDLRGNNSKLGSENLALSESNNILFLENEKYSSVLDSISDDYVVSVDGTYYSLSIASSGVKYDISTTILGGYLGECTGGSMSSVISDFYTKLDGAIILSCDYYTRLNVLDINTEIVSSLDYVTCPFDLSGVDISSKFEYNADTFKYLDNSSIYKYRLDLEIVDQSDASDGSILWFIFTFNLA